MKPIVSRCDDNRLHVLIDGDENSSAFLEAAQHVETCSHCQLRLATLAADETDWTAAQRMLSTQDMDPQLEQERAERSWSIASPLQPQKAWTDAMAKHLLSKPSHPEMLGRLGRYEIENLIGSGGMGVVFKGFDSELNRPVAIKVLAPHLAGNGAARKRFAREAKAAAAVVHEHVIAIHNVESEAETPFLVMPFIAGESLQSRIDRQGPLELREVLRIACQTAAGLAAAHKQGLVHRDVKPSNIMLEQGVERALLTDFGLARASDDASLTQSGHLPGTPHFMAPEQARGENADQRSDLFSLGSTMYAMCTGRLPFRAETSYGVLRRITDDEPASVDEVNTDMPRWLAAFVCKLMSKDAAHRFASADEVSLLLEQGLAHVQQPSVVDLPAKLKVPQERSSVSRISGSLIVLGAFILAAAIAFGVVTAPPEITGKWHGAEWGNVELQSRNSKDYDGTYFRVKPGANDAKGTVKLKWSRIERRFNGTWAEGTDRFGELSVHIVNGEIHGVRTTIRDLPGNRQSPRLAELVWRPGAVEMVAGASDSVVSKSNAMKREPASADVEAEPVKPVDTQIESDWDADDLAFEQLSKTAEELFQRIENDE